LLAYEAAKELNMVRRRGLIRSAARTAGRTAVIAGTATAVSGRVANRQRQTDAHQHEPPPVAANPGAAGGAEVVGRLQQLADLRASGALTEKEFATAKARLLQN
jgi:Short C-terminal domain